MSEGDGKEATAAVNLEMGGGVWLVVTLLEESEEGWQRSQAVTELSTH